MWSYKQRNLFGENDILNLYENWINQIFFFDHCICQIVWTGNGKGIMLYPIWVRQFDATAAESKRVSSFFYFVKHLIIFSFSIFVFILFYKVGFVTTFGFFFFFFSNEN